MGYLAKAAVVLVGCLAIATLSVHGFEAGQPVKVASGSAGIDESAAFVKKFIVENPVAVFSKSYCPYSMRAKQVFDKLGVKPAVVELDHRDDGPMIQAALQKLVGRRTVPQVFIDGNHLGGSDETVAAHETGDLKTRLKAKQATPEL